MEIRSVEFEVRIADEQTRSVSGLAVPYGQTINIGGFQERVERGAFDTSVQVPLLWGHDHREIPIGKVTALRDTDAGLEIDAQLNETSRGKDAYIALKNGDVSKFSIGFLPVESRNEDDVIVRTKATLKEVSVVNFPAYDQASVTSVREANNNTKENGNMTENVNDYSAEIGDIRGEIADLSRKFDRISEADNSGDSALNQYRSGGEFLKALVRGEDAAVEIFNTRAFADSTDADNIRPTWINKTLKLVEKQRIVKGLFVQEPLPADRLSVEYPYVSGTTGEVDEQVAEGDDLDYIELVVDTRSAPVKTYGGYSSVSRQVIERSDVAYLEALLRKQAISYAAKTEAIVQAALVGATGTNTAVELGGANSAAHTAAQWIEAVLDAKAAIDANSTGLQADVILVAPDVHKKMALIVDSTGRPVFEVNADGSNTYGSLPLNGNLRGMIDGTPLVVGKNLPAGTVIVASSECLTSWESPGAPFRLQDENVVNLTKDFSLYGYMAVGITDAKGITKITDAS